MYLGVDYYPEHWDQFLIDEDMERILKTGANTIRIGEFAWHLMEPEEGQFDFSYFDRVLHKAREYGLKVIFGTPTATFPAWLYKKHPSLLSKDEKGQVRAFGGRRQYCFNSEIYRAYAMRISEELVKHYANEELIEVWQIDNEFGHEGSDMCFCGACHEQFQGYLKYKYGHIDILNKTYGTIFWGQTYNGFDEVPIPTPTITTHNPTLQLDWARFRSESINSFALEQIAVVKKFKGPHQKITHNYFGGFFNVAYDQNIMSEALDVVSYDNYPVWGGLEKPISPGNIAMTHDYMRGLKQQNFWILEELMGAQGHTDIGYLPRPNQAKLWAYQAMAKGCESLLFFRWRTMTRGAEQHCQGILDADNRDNRKLEEVTDFFKDIIQHQDILTAPIQSEVAVLYDFDNRWSWRYQPQSSGFDFTTELLRIYEGFHHWNVAMDVISIDRDFSPYKVLVLPVMQIVDSALRNRLEAFAEAGGTVIFTYRSGIKDRDNNLFFGEIAPCHIRELCGIEVAEFESLGANATVGIMDLQGDHEVVYEAAVWRDLLVAKEAVVLYAYTDSAYNGYGAISKNVFGKGHVYYIGCGIESALSRLIAKQVIDHDELNHEASESGVEVVCRWNGNSGIKFIMNHNGFETKHGGQPLKPYEVKIEKA